MELHHQVRTLAPRRTTRSWTACIAPAAKPVTRRGGVCCQTGLRSRRRPTRRGRRRRRPAARRERRHPLRLRFNPAAGSFGGRVHGKRLPRRRGRRPKKKGRQASAERLLVGDQARASQGSFSSRPRITGNTFRANTPQLHSCALLPLPLRRARRLLLRLFEPHCGGSKPLLPWDVGCPDRPLAANADRLPQPNQGCPQLHQKTICASNVAAAMPPVRRLMLTLCCARLKPVMVCRIVEIAIVGAHR